MSRTETIAANIIQCLDQRIAELNQRIAKLDQRIAELKQQLEVVEAILAPSPA